jgi:hypothetical protein
MEKNESLEDRVQRGLREAATNILQGIPKILMGMKDVLAGVSQWGDEKLFQMRILVEAWGIDAIVRLVGLSDDPALDPGITYGKASKIFKKLDQGEDIFSNLLALTNDNESIETLLKIWFLYLRINIEIPRRLKSRKIGMKFFKFINRGFIKESYQKLIDDLTDQTGKQLRAGIRKSKKFVRLPEETLNFLIPMSWRTLDRKGQITIEYSDRFKEFIERLKPEKHESFKENYSILKDKRPLNNPAWDNLAPRMLAVMTGLLQASLPMLCGETERIPFNIYNKYRTESRRQKVERNEVSLSILDDYNRDDGKKERDKKDIENTFKLIFEQKEREWNPDNQIEKLKEMIKTQSLSKGEKRIINLILQPNYKESAKQKDLAKLINRTPRTIQRDIKSLKSKLRQPS